MPRQRREARELIRAICDHQRSHRMTDGEVARMLGVSRQLWVMIRRDRTAVSLDFAQRAAAFEDFREAAIAVLVPPAAA